MGTMDKDTADCISANTYETKGQMNLLRNDLREYHKSVRVLLLMIFFYLVVIGIRLG